MTIVQQPIFLYISVSYYYVHTFSSYKHFFILCCNSTSFYNAYISSLHDKTNGFLGTNSCKYSVEHTDFVVIQIKVRNLNYFELKSFFKNTLQNQCFL